MVTKQQIKDFKTEEHFKKSLNDRTEIGLSDFKIHLFTPNYVHDADIDIANKIYAEWKKTFKDIVESKGGILDPDDFFRSNYVLAITKSDEVVALSTMTLFDLRLNSNLDHHYIKALDTSTPNVILTRNINRLFSIEYLNILPTWRKSETELPWVEILIGLSLKWMDQSDADAVIGTPRIDVKVINSCRNLEGIEIQDPILKMNYPCAVVIFPKQQNRKFQNPLTQLYVNTLFEKMDSSNYQKIEQEPYLKEIA